jgi:hypothetical protein
VLIAWSDSAMFVCKVVDPSLVLRGGCEWLCGGQKDSLASFGFLQTKFPTGFSGLMELGKMAHQLLLCQ